jgi:hypothetical protein
MNSHKLLLPLAETESDNPGELSIKVHDIWYFERSQLHNNPSYDESFALQLLNRIEQLIATKSKPDFVVDPNDKETGYQLNKLSLHSSKYADITERFALDYFFLLDSYYSYSKEILVTPSDDEFWYWFSLKLRQYDLSLEKVNEFLNFQLKKCSTKRGTDFIEKLSLSLLQYPDFFSDRLLQTVNVWINKNKKEAVSLNVAQSYNVLQTDEDSLSDNVAQTDNIKKSIRKETKSTSKFKWNKASNKEEQLKLLHKQLINNDFISTITYEGFESNFDGKLNKKLKINWLKERIALIHLLNELKNFLNPDIYTKYDGTIGIAYFAAHFLHKGEVINIRNWTSAKSRLNENKEKYKENISCNSIDLIISNIKGLA